MIELQFIQREDLSREEIDALWEQDVNMDDWDYMIFSTDIDLREMNDIDGFTTWHPHTYYVDNLLQGVCENRWYPDIEFKGQTGTLGVAYHA